MKSAPGWLGCDHGEAEASLSDGWDTQFSNGPVLYNTRIGLLLVGREVGSLSADGEALFFQAYPLLVGEQLRGGLLFLSSSHWPLI